MGSVRINFIKKTLQDIPPAPPGKRAYYRDEKTPRLILDVTSSGAKSFYWYGKVNHRAERIFIGRFPETTIEQARTRSMEISGKVGRGDNPQDEVRAHREEMTVRELFDEYISRHASKKRKTWEVMIKDFERNAASVANFKLSAVTAGRAERLHQELKAAKGPYAANRMVQLLKAVFNKGAEWELFSGRNPFTGITLFPERPRDRFLTDDEAARLLKALENETKGILKDFITLSLFTGVRRSNLGSMRWKDVDLAQGTWLIPDTKNGTPQHVSLGAFELDILKKRRAKSNDNDVFVFPGPGKSGHMIDIKTAWIRFRKSIGLNDVTIHDLRRSLAAGMASNNVNIALVKDALNHRDLKTTIAVYARTRKSAVVEAKENLHSSWVAKAKQLNEPMDERKDSESCD